MEDSIFVCPKCSRNKFGTLNPTLPREKWIGKCSGCGFEWPRVLDDQYFAVVYQPYRKPTAKKKSLEDARKRVRELYADHPRPHDQPSKIEMALGRVLSDPVMAAAFILEHAAETGLLDDFPEQSQTLTYPLQSIPKDGWLVADGVSLPEEVNSKPFWAQGRDGNINFFRPADLVHVARFFDHSRPDKLAESDFVSYRVWQGKFQV